MTTTYLGSGDGSQRLVLTLTPPHPNPIPQMLYDYVTTSAFSQPSIWELCNEKGGVKVWRTYHDVKTGSGTSPTPTIKARRVIDATPAEAYALFIDDERVSEYNANCAEVRVRVRVGLGFVQSGERRGGTVPVVSNTINNNTTIARGSRPALPDLDLPDQGQLVRNL